MSSNEILSTYYIIKYFTYIVIKKSATNTYAELLILKSEAIVHFEYN